MPVALRPAPLTRRPAPVPLGLDRLRRRLAARAGPPRSHAGPLVRRLARPAARLVALAAGLGRPPARLSRLGPGLRRPWRSEAWRRRRARRGRGWWPWPARRVARRLERPGAPVRRA